MRLTYKKSLRLDGLSVDQINQTTANLAAHMKILMQKHFPNRSKYNVQIEEEDNWLNIQVKRGSFFGQYESFLGEDLVKVGGAQEQVYLLNVSAQYQNTAVESALEQGEQIESNLKKLGLVTLGTFFAVVTTLFQIGFAGRIYGYLIFISFAVGGGIGSFIGGMIGDAKLQEAQKKKTVDVDSVEAEKDWGAFVNDLIGIVEPKR